MGVKGGWKISKYLPVGTIIVVFLNYPLDENTCTSKYKTIDH